MSLLNYQEDFFTPGISPRLANSRKQIRHKPNIRIYARLRPQRKQRRTMRVENLGFLLARAITEIFAILFLLGFLLERNL